MKIAIIGGGLSGITALTHLVNLYKDSNQLIEITLYEKEADNIATGFPFRTDTPHEWILNGPPAKRFKLHSNGATLETYIKENYPFLKNLFPELTENEQFPPRGCRSLFTKRTCKK